MNTLILRIGAILILLSLLEKVPFSVEILSNTWQNSQNINAILFSMAPGIFALFVSFLLWFYPSTISSKLSAPTDNLNVESDYEKALGEILITVLGLYIIANAIPDLIYHIVLYSFITSSSTLYRTTRIWKFYRLIALHQLRLS